MKNAPKHDISQTLVKHQTHVASVNLKQKSISVLIEEKCLSYKKRVVCSLLCNKTLIYIFFLKDETKSPLWLRV